LSLRLFSAVGKDKVNLGNPRGTILRFTTGVFQAQ
jgi:hypothetical protein